MLPQLVRVYHGPDGAPGGEAPSAPAPTDPAPPASAPAAPPAPPTPTTETTFDAKYVETLRQEAAKHRTEKQAVRTELDAFKASVSKMLGIDDGTPPDPAKLQEQLTGLQRENRELKLSGALLEAARKHGADTDLLVPYLRGSSALDALDIASATFAKDLADVVKNVVEKNPKLKAAAQAAPRSVVDLPGGGQPPVQQYTRDQLKSMSPDQINEARKAGHLDAIMRGQA